jgi:PAS domain-containing protein
MTYPSAVLIKACLKGNTSVDAHPAVPMSPEELARDAQRAVAAGAGALHVHAQARARLEAPVEALLSSIEYAAVVVDADGTPLRANAAYRRLYSESVLVPLHEQGKPLPPEATPQQRAVRGETFTMEFVLPPRRGAARRRRFAARGQPNRVGDAVHGGLVVMGARWGK